MLPARFEPAIPATALEIVATDVSKIYPLVKIITAEFEEMNENDILLCIMIGWCRATVRHHPHRTHDLCSGSQDHHPSKNSVQKTICCNSTSNAPDDGRMYPKHVELRIHQ